MIQRSLQHQQEWQRTAGVAPLWTWVLLVTVAGCGHSSTSLPATPCADSSSMPWDEDHVQVAARIEKLGGQVGPLSTSSKFPYVDIKMGREWQGTDEDLLLLSTFQWVDELSLQGESFSDGALAVLERVRGPSVLHLSDTKISPQGLEGFLQSKANSISVLEINSPQFGDASLQHLERLKFLKWLTIGPDCRITDQGVRELGKLKQLLFLQINVPGVTGNQFSALAGLVSLRGLVLAGTGADDNTIAELGCLASLNYLDLSRTEVSGAGLNTLACLTCLNTLILDETPISDVALTNLQSLPALEAISLDKTAIGDEHMKILGRLAWATTISLNNTAVTTAGIAELRNIRTLLTATDGSGKTYIFQKSWARLHGGQLHSDKQGKVFLWTEAVPQAWLRDKTGVESKEKQ